MNVRNLVLLPFICFGFLNLLALPILFFEGSPISPVYAAYAAAFLLLLRFVRWSSRDLISRPPGWGLRRFGDFCFSRTTFTEVLEPPLSDMQLEHFEALAAGRRWKARMVLVRGYWSFWSAVAMQLPIPLLRRVYEVWKASKTGS